MEYNEIKDLLNQTKAPSLSSKTKDHQDTKEINDFMEDLKKTDVKNSKMHKRFYVMYILAVVFYVLLFIVNPDKNLGWQERIIGMGFIGALLVYVYYFKLTKRAYTDQNFDKPTLEFLAEAEKRYRFWNKKNYILIPALLLIDFASCFTFFKHYYSIEHNLASGIIISQLVFLSICLIGLWLGKRNWKRNNAPVYESIVTLTNSFTDDTVGNQ